MDHRKAVRDFIQQEIFENNRGTKVLSDGDLLITSGRINSLSSLILLGFVEKLIGKSLLDTDFSIENIDTIDAICAFIALHGNQEA